MEIGNVDQDKAKPWEVGSQDEMEEYIDAFIDKYIKFLLKKGVDENLISKIKKARSDLDLEGILKAVSSATETIDR